MMPFWGIILWLAMGYAPTDCRAIMQDGDFHLVYGHVYKNGTQEWTVDERPCLAAALTDEEMRTLERGHGYRLWNIPDTTVELKLKLHKNRGR